MSEWQVVQVIGELGVLAGLVVKVVVPLTKTMAELSLTLKHLQAGLNEQKEKAHESHQRLWDKAEEQDKLLGDHEKRIGRLEGATHEE